MSKEISNPRRDLAQQFMLRTGRNIFLTGKAGTGKTTLLRDIVFKTTKKHIIVAPTGVAAMNAGGMTIHSVFQLPPSTFVPSNVTMDPDRYVTRSHLATHQRIVKERIDLLRNLELLIIDEISMVRADLLDAIDFTLRRIRRSSEVFGGVQVIVIGDLYQLSPVVQPDTWQVLAEYYASPYFFSSHSWQQADAIVIELDQVYRQADEHFVSLLNRIRAGIRKDEDVHLINQNLTEHPPRDEDIITLTTHNRKADKINKEELDKLDTEPITLSAVVRGSFNKNAYPIPAEIIVKPGAQVMFVKNDPEGGWYNGKLATVVDMTGDTLIVEDSDDRRIEVDREEWKNTKYTVDKKTKDITKEELGSYLQYPLRLAWAITVHKSQGLTFDDVILDLENTFADGQLYVALSRARSLEGIVMTSKIQKYHIKVDDRINQYYQQHTLPADIDQTLLQDIKAEEDRRLARAFDISRILAYTEDWHFYILNNDVEQKKSRLTKAGKVVLALEELEAIAAKFKSQIEHIAATQADLGEQAAQILDRSAKAVAYFTDEIYARAVVPVNVHYAKVKKAQDERKYQRYLSQILGEYWHAIDTLYDLSYSNQPVYTDERKHKRQKTFDAKQAIAEAGSGRKGETYEITLELYKSGKSIEEIAKHRSLSAGTIEGHIGRWINRDEIKITDVLSKDKLDAAVTVLMDSPDAELSSVRSKIPLLLTWGELRWVQTYVRKTLAQLDE